MTRILWVAGLSALFSASCGHDDPTIESQTPAQSFAGTYQYVAQGARSCTETPGQFGYVCNCQPDYTYEGTLTLTAAGELLGGELVYRKCEGGTCSGPAIHAPVV